MCRCCHAGAHLPPSPTSHTRFLGFSLYSLAIYPEKRRESYLLIFDSTLSSQNFFTLSGSPNSTYRTSARLNLLVTRSLSLQSHFNPVTCKKVCLPPMKLSWFDEVHINRNYRDSVLIYSVSNFRISYWRLWDANWSAIYVPDPLYMLAYYKGFYFNMDKSDWITESYDANTSEYVLEIPTPVCKSNFKGFHYPGSYVGFVD